MTDNAVSVSVDLRQLGAELQMVSREFATAVRKNVRAAVTASGGEVLQKVQDAASWSTRIPAATKLSASFGARTAGITIRTSAAQAPHARPFEMGNGDDFDGPGGARSADSPVNRRVAAGTAVSRRHAIAQLRAEGDTGARTLRHPVFHKADEPGGWAVEPTRPYFFASTEAMTPEMEATFAAAITVAVREAGFR